MPTQVLLNHELEIIHVHAKHRKTCSSNVHSLRLVLIEVLDPQRGADRHPATVTARCSSKMDNLAMACTGLVKMNSV